MIRGWVWTTCRGRRVFYDSLHGPPRTSEHRPCRTHSGVERSGDPHFTYSQGSAGVGVRLPGRTLTHTLAHTHRLSCVSFVFYRRRRVSVERPEQIIRPPRPRWKSTFTDVVRPTPTRRTLGRSNLSSTRTEAVSSKVGRRPPVHLCVTSQNKS